VCVLIRVCSFCVYFDTCVLELCIDISKITQMTQKTPYCTAICVRRHVLQVVAACWATCASTNLRLKHNVCIDICTSHTLLHEFTQCMFELGEANQSNRRRRLYTRSIRVGACGPDCFFLVCWVKRPSICTHSSKLVCICIVWS